MNTPGKLIRMLLYAGTALKAKRAGIATSHGVRLALSGKYGISRTARVFIGAEALLSYRHQIVAEDDSVIHIGASVHIAEDARLVARAGARILIGDDCFFGHDVSIVAAGEITIGAKCLFAPYCYLHDSNHNTALGLPIKEQDHSVAPIVIGSDVWCAVGVTVLSGARVADGAVLAARAVLNRSVPANEIWGGVPAKRIGNRE
jgi:acetyltransferase-like isoleucine patch superfamily enzyme